MTIVDTTVWVDYINGVANAQTDWLHRKFDKRALALTDLVLCEVLQGIRHDALFQRMQLMFSLFDIFESSSVEIAVASAENYRLLRARGITVRKTIDCLVATFCIQQGHSLLHRDRDFDPFEQHLGLRVIHPSGGHARSRDLQ